MLKIDSKSLIGGLDQMESRERIERQMQFRSVDRLPILGGWLTSIAQYEALAGQVDGAYKENAIPTAIQAYRRLHCDALIALILPQPPDYSYNSAAARLHIREEARALYPTHESVLAYVKSLPDPGRLRGTFQAQAFYDHTLAEIQERQAQLGGMIWLQANWHADGYFMWYSMFDNLPYLEAMGLYPQQMRKLFEHAAVEAYLRNQVLARLYTEHDICKLMLMGQDICGQRGPMVSVRFLEWYFSLAKEALRPLVDAGFKLIWHSDGHVLPIADLILAAGVHGFQGFQWETGTTIDRLAQRRTIDGQRPLFFSGVNASRTMVYGSPGDIRHEIDHHIEVTEGGKGLFFLPSNTLNPDIPLENILAAYDYVFERSL